MKFLKVALAGALAATMLPVSAALVNTSGPESPDLQEVINSFYAFDPILNPTGICTDPACSPVSSAPNVNTNQVIDSGLFATEASGFSNVRLVFEFTANAGSNVFGIYNPANPAERLQLFSGAASTGSGAVMDFLFINPGYQVTNLATSAVLLLPTNAFGFYFTTPNGTYFSQPILNAGGIDMMAVYQGDNDRIRLSAGLPNGAQWGTSSFLLAWEDWNNPSSDYDYNDFGAYVESVSLVPAPGVLALLGVGLLGIGALRRRA